MGGDEGSEEFPGPDEESEGQCGDERARAPAMTGLELGKAPELFGGGGLTIWEFVEAAEDEAVGCKEREPPGPEADPEVGGRASSDCEAPTS